MPRLLLFFAAEAISGDASEYALNASGILTVLKPKGFPAIIPVCELLSVWAMTEDDDEGEHQEFSIETTLPSGEKVSSAANFVTLGPHDRNILRMRNLPLPTPGRLQFVGRLNGDVVAEYSVEILGEERDDYAKVELLGVFSTSDVTTREYPCAGISHRQDVARAFAEAGGGDIELRREAFNTHDENAVAVWCRYGQLGYVPREYSEEIAGLLDGGTQLRASLLWVGEPEAEMIGLRFGIEVD